MRCFAIRHGLLPLVILLALATSASAQKKADPLGASLGLTTESKSLPLWTKPSDTAVQEMTATIRRLRDAILIVGIPDTEHGTAWVVSKKHRLLATNAHVADIMHDGDGKMIGIRNGTSVVYEIDKAWYHPGVRRYKNAEFAVRSADPADGEVDPDSPDVAVLHVAEGPDLPEEFQLATAEEEEDCLGVSIGMMGFPGHDTEAFPKIGQKAQATLREGIVCRQTDFFGGVNGEAAEMQKLQHSLASWPGFSGSPLFLANGHVIGLHNAGRGESRGNRHVELAYGVRIDCLWELLAYHHLDDKVALPIDKSKLLLARYEKPDPALEKYNAAAKLVAESDGYFLEKRYSEGVEKCNAAIKICPGYSKAFFYRAVFYTRYNIERFSSGTAGDAPVDPEQVKFATYALNDSHTYMEMNPNDPEAFLLYCMKLSDLDVIRHGFSEKRYNTIVDLTTKMIDDKSLSPRIKARAYSARAAIKTIRPDASEISDEIYDDYGAALKLDPYNSNLWRNRGGYDRSGSEIEAADFRRAKELDEADQAAGHALYLAGATDDKERDGRKAWDLALAANKATNYEAPQHLFALAAAYAECNDFDHAVEYQKKAVSLAEETEKAQLEQALKLFEDKKPYRAE